MKSLSKYLLASALCVFSFVCVQAQCPPRPDPGSVVKDALSIDSVNGVLNAELTMRHSVDTGGYNHYCMNYDTGKGEAEAPTLRLNQGDRLILDVKDRIESDDDSSGMAMDMSGLPICGDSGTPTLSSTTFTFTA
jgi:hypothetical protein